MSCKSRGTESCVRADWNNLRPWLLHDAFSWGVPSQGVLRLAAASGVLDVLQTGGLDAEDLLHLERFGYEPRKKARKRSKVRAAAGELSFSSPNANRQPGFVVVCQVCLSLQSRHCFAVRV